MDVFANLPEETIVKNYIKNYGLGNEITIEHVRKHAALEGELTKRVLDSAPDGRARIISHSYSQLYAELPWLSHTGGRPHLRAWRSLLAPGSSILEIGSGNGALITYLAKQGYSCSATEISSERGQKFVDPESGVIWLQSDGIHLDRISPPATYDYVISDQVVEHLHPAAILEHFRAVHAILKPNGRYILRTPHRSVGPSDLSRVFRIDRAIFMHLHEFTFAELAAIAVDCGYREASAVVYLPRLSERFGLCRSSRLFMRLMVGLDRIEPAIVTTNSGRHRFRCIARALLAPSNIWVSLQK